MKVSGRHYAPAMAMALVCDPAMAGSQPIPDLSRDQRELAAFGGFENLSAEYYDVQVDDDQIYFDFPTTYERRVQSDRVGVIFR